MLILLCLMVVVFVLVVFVFERNFRREQRQFTQRIQRLQETIAQHHLEYERQKIKLELCDDFKEEFSKKRTTIGESIFALHVQMFEIINASKTD